MRCRRATGIPCWLIARRREKCQTLGTRCKRIRICDRLADIERQFSQRMCFETPNESTRARALRVDDVAVEITNNLTGALLHSRRRTGNVMEVFADFGYVID